MIVQVTSQCVVVAEPDDCLSLHVASNLPPHAVDEALRSSGLGRVGEGGQVMLDVVQLRDRAIAAGVTTDWPSHWDGMIEFASCKGWLSSDHSVVFAHLEADGGNSG